MKDVKIDVEKMTRNHRKMIEQTGDSLLLSKHSIQLSALFLLLSDTNLKNASIVYVNVPSEGRLDQRTINEHN